MTIVASHEQIRHPVVYSLNEWQEYWSILQENLSLTILSFVRFPHCETNIDRQYSIVNEKVTPSILQNITNKRTKKHWPHWVLYIIDFCIIAIYPHLLSLDHWYFQSDMLVFLCYVIMRDGLTNTLKLCKTKVVNINEVIANGGVSH